MSEIQGKINLGVNNNSKNSDINSIFNASMRGSNDKSFDFKNSRLITKGPSLNKNTSNISGNFGKEMSFRLID